MSNVSSDVEYLRQQYNKGKSQSNQLVVKYNNEQFQDGDVLKKSDTQDTPKVQVNIEVDPQNPYFTLVNIHIYIFFKLYFLFFKVFADPDAPQRGNERAGPWLHGIQSGFKRDDINNGKTLGINFSFSIKKKNFIFISQLNIKVQHLHQVLVHINIYFYYINQLLVIFLKMMDQLLLVIQEDVNNFI